jgi:hypothetical protein
MSTISDYLESDNSLIYTSTCSVREHIAGWCVEIDLIMIHTLVTRIRYFYDADILIVGDCYTGSAREVKNFSTICTEERYFQQMTVQDCTDFEFHEVPEFISKIKRIIIYET